jgi:hypothetical protein
MRKAVHVLTSGTGPSPAPTTEADHSSEVHEIHRRSSEVQTWIQHIALLVLLGAFAITGFIPAWRHLNSDFPNYYLVARLYRAGYPLDRVYEWTWLQRQKDHQRIDQGLVSFIPSTLPSALAVIPWSSLPPLEAKHGWLLMNLVFLLLIHFLLTRITTLGSERIALLMLLAFLPLRDNFRLGQMHILVLLLLTLAAWLYFKNWHYLTGASLATAAALKIYPALFLIFFLWKKQWRAAIGLVVGLLGAAVLSVYLFGKDACVLYAREVLPAGLRGETIDPYSTSWNSLTALLRRLFIAEPELNPTPIAHLPWLYAVLQPLIHVLIFIVFMWTVRSHEHDAERTKIEWATFLFLLLFLSSQPGSYHFVAMMLVVTLIVDSLVVHQQNILAGFALLTYILICGPLIRVPGASPTGWQNLLFFSRLAFTAVFGGVLLWMSYQRSKESRETYFNFRRAAVAASSVVILATLGFVSNERHLRGQFDNYKTRVGTTPGALLASNPALTADSVVLFTGMTTHGYTIRRLQAGRTMDVDGSDDWFHPATSQKTDLVWAEQSSRAGSRVVQFAFRNSQSITEVKSEVEDAEDPLVSHDGQFLAFLRAVNGRNSLWVRKISAAPGQREAAQATQIAGSEYDVRDSSFTPDNRLVFSSQRTGRFVLYTSTLSGVIQELPGPTCPARYPAVSPDGNWVAFSCDYGGSWQLRAMDFNTKAELQLTRGECNSISPAWTVDSRSLIYATDCGRGLGLTALAEVSVFHQGSP